MEAENRWHRGISAGETDADDNLPTHQANRNREENRT